MMRSLFSGVAGLRTHQSRMDVIGNNIANVNTTGYKSQSMVFSDLMYQTTQAASGANPASGRGGVNARQIGLGSKTGAIKTAITNQGSAQSTNDGFDMMIDGSSFFVVSDGQQNYFTRDGSFYVDGAGNLCMTSNGYTVMGWQVDQVTGEITKGTVSPLRIMSDDTRFYSPEVTSQARIIGNVDKLDPDVNGTNGRVMDLEFYDDAGYKYTAKLSVHAKAADKGEFTIQIDDILDANGKSVLYEAELVDGERKKKEGMGAQLGGKDAVDLVFDPADGTFKSVDGGDTFKLTVTGLPAMEGHTITVDCSTMTNVNTNGSSTCSALKGTDNGEGTGRMQGERIGVSVQQDGKIYLSYSNGMSRLIGQIAVASFANASGLAKAGNNLYSATMNSGEFDGIGHDVTEDGGVINTGVLEMSNVELAQEFTEMITTQRGFQANSRTITVSDTLLEELINLKR